eukprot:g28782.t1
MSDVEAGGVESEDEGYPIFIMFGEGWWLRAMDEKWRAIWTMGGELENVKGGGEHAPIYINRTEVERVESIKLLRVTITDNLSWTSNRDAMVKKAQQRLFFLRQLRKFGMSVRTLTNFYRCTIESILSGCIKAWYGNCSAQDHKKLQKM